MATKYFESEEPYDVLILVGSPTDQEPLDKSGMFKFFDDAGVRYHQSQVSADRHSNDVKRICDEAVHHGVSVFIGVAGMSAILPSAMGAALEWEYPVIGVGLDVGFDGMDSLLSIISKPRGCPVACTGVGPHALLNAAILACQILALTNTECSRGLNYALAEFRSDPKRQPAFGVRKSQTLTKAK